MDELVRFAVGDRFGANTEDWNAAQADMGGSLWASADQQTLARSYRLPCPVRLAVGPWSVLAPEVAADKMSERQAASPWASAEADAAAAGC